MDQLATLLPLAALAVLFWLLIIRPASRRQKAVAQLQADLQPGQRVMLTSGIFGTVQSLLEDRAVIEIAPGTSIEVARAAIGVVERPEDSGDSNDPGEEPAVRPEEL